MNHLIYLANISWAMIMPISLLSAPWFVLSWMRLKRRRTLNHSAKLTEVDLQNYPNHDPEFYASTRIILEKLNFLYLGDVARKSAILSRDKNEIPLRLMVSPCLNHLVAFSRYKFSGIIGFLFRNFTQKEYYKAIEIYTRLSNGEYTITTNSIPTGKTEGLENHNRLYVSDRNQTDNIYKLHQTRVNEYLKRNSNVKALSLDSRYEAYLAIYEIYTQITNAWHQSGYKLTHKEHKALKARRYDQQRMIITPDMLHHSLTGISASLPQIMIDSRHQKSELNDQWFYTMRGKEYGPLSLKKLQKLQDKGEIKETDLAWTNSMPEWCPISHIPELQSSRLAPTPDKSTFGNIQSESPSETETFDKVNGLHRPGVRRLYFWLWTLPALLFAIFANEISLTTYQFIRTDIILVISWIILIYGIGSRLTNLSMHYIWTLALFVPFLNIWLGYRLYCCPPGYGEHHTKDSKTSLFTKLYITLFTAFISYSIYWILKSIYTQ